MSTGRRSRLVLACLVVGLASGGTLRAQAPETKAPRTDVLPPVNVELVRLDVVVTGRKGEPMPGLRREDFVVYEDGEPQTIVQFQAYGSEPATTSPEPVEPQAPAATVPGGPPLAPRRYVVLAVDDVHMETGSLVRIKKALRRFVEEDLGPEDLAAVVTTSGAVSSAAYPFTGDAAVLDEAIDRLSPQNRHAEWNAPPYISEYQAELIEEGDPMALEVAVQEIMLLGFYQDVAPAEAVVRRKASGIFRESVYNARLTLETLEGLVRGLAGLNGRKVVFLVSDGFLTGISARSGSSFDVRRITDAGTRAGVVVYALDARGLVAAPPVATASSRRPTISFAVGTIEAMRRRSENAERTAMHALAADTGGFLVESSNDLRAGLQRMLKDTQTYYVLAYEPTKPWVDGSYRKVEVKVPGLRDARVRARSGYFASDASHVDPAIEARAAEARRTQVSETALREALGSPTRLTGLPVHLSADFVSLEGGVPQVVVSGEIDTTSLAVAEGQDRRTIEAVAAVFDARGKVAGNLGSERTTMRVVASPDGAATPHDGVLYEKTAPLEPGRYQVRLAARDERTGKVGSATEWVNIPDLARGGLTISSLFLLKAEGEPRSGSGSAPLRSVQAERRFRRDESLYVRLYAYNPKLDASGEARLVSQAEILRNGVLLGTGAPEPLPQGRAGSPPLAHTTRIGLRGLEPGDYELRITVTDRNADALTTRRVAFSVD